MNTLGKKTQLQPKPASVAKFKSEKLGLTDASMKGVHLGGDWYGDKQSIVFHIRATIFVRWIHTWSREHLLFLDIKAPQALTDEKPDRCDADEVTALQTASSARPWDRF